VQRRYRDERSNHPVNFGQTSGEMKMIETGSIFLLILNILSIPLQLYRYLVFAGLDFLAFDVLRLGPYLPIKL
jgi:uncharacterized membrane protein